MFEKIAITILFLAAAAAVGWGIHERSLAGKMQFERDQALAQKAEADNKAILELREALQQQQRQAEVLKKDFNAASEQVASLKKRVPASPTATPALPATVAKAALTSGSASGGQADKTTAASAKPFMANLAKMMKDPAMKKTMQAQQKAMMDTAWSPLFDMLDLPADKVASLKDIIEKNQTESMNIGLDMLDDSLTPEQKAEKRQRLKDLEAQKEKDIEALLGKDNYAIYKTYKDTQPERMQVNAYNQALTDDIRLDDAQQNDLVFAMHKARTDFHYTSDLDKMKDNGIDPSTLTPEQIGQYFQETRQLNAKYIEAASKVLAPPQLEKFKAALERQVAMMELGFNMIYGGGKPKMK